MRDNADLHRRLDAVARAGDSGMDAHELDDLLTEGYAHALAGEAESRQLARQLASLMPDIDKPGVAKEARRLALQRRTVDQAVGDLRVKLARLRRGVAPAHEHPSTSA